MKKSDEANLLGTLLDQIQFKCNLDQEGDCEQNQNIRRKLAGYIGAMDQKINSVVDSIGKFEWYT